MAMVSCYLYKRPITKVCTVIMNGGHFYPGQFVSWTICYHTKELLTPWYMSNPPICWFFTQPFGPMSKHSFWIITSYRWNKKYFAKLAKTLWPHRKNIFALLVASRFDMLKIVFHANHHVVKIFWPHVRFDIHHVFENILASYFEDILMPLFNTIPGFMCMHLLLKMIDAHIYALILASYHRNILMTMSNTRFDTHHVLSIFWHPTTFLTPARASPAAKPLRNVIFGASFGRLWSIFKPPLLGKNSLGCENSLRCKTYFGLSWLLL